MSREGRKLKKEDCFFEFSTEIPGKMNDANGVEDYIAGFPKEVQERMRVLRKIITEVAPEAAESISYRIPYYNLHGRLVYFAGFERHMGLYPMASGMRAFKKELGSYKQGKGSVQFPHDEPLPVALIKKIVRFRVKENTSKKKG
jgi:uncharacterized protein YdhG (YjbR/CyaY superfamily)